MEQIDTTEKKAALVEESVTSPQIMAGLTAIMAERVIVFRLDKTVYAEQI